MDGRSGGRSVYGHVITKFSRMGSLPHFLIHGAPLRALRARELRCKGHVLLLRPYSPQDLREQLQSDLVSNGEENRPSRIIIYQKRFENFSEMRSS